MRVFEKPFEGHFSWDDSNLIFIFSTINPYLIAGRTKWSKGSSVTTSFSWTWPRTASRDKLLCRGFWFWALEDFYSVFVVVAFVFLYLCSCWSGYRSVDNIFLKSDWCLFLKVASFWGWSFWLHTIFVSFYLILVYMLLYLKLSNVSHMKVRCWHGKTAKILEKLYIAVCQYHLTQTTILVTSAFKLLGSF